MRLPLAALGAVVLALLELSVAPYLEVGGVKPDLVLIAVVLISATFGLDGAVAWAFIGGLMIDLLSANPVRPIGTTAIALLLVAGLTAGAVRLLPGSRFALAVALTFVATFVYELAVLALFDVSGAGVPVPDPLGAVLPIAVVDALLAIPLAAGLRVLARRYGSQERLEW